MAMMALKAPDVKVTVVDINEKRCEALPWHIPLVLAYFPALGLFMRRRPSNTPLLTAVATCGVQCLMQLTVQECLVAPGSLYTVLSLRLLPAAGLQPG